MAKIPDFKENLPNYCERGVLRSPTMWVGIFAGGYAKYSSFIDNRALLIFCAIAFLLS